jgi:hypothetical protein
VYSFVVDLFRLVVELEAPLATVFRENIDIDIDIGIGIEEAQETQEVAAPEETTCLTVPVHLTIIVVRSQEQEVVLRCQATDSGGSLSALEQIVRDLAVAPLVYMNGLVHAAVAVGKDQQMGAEALFLLQSKLSLWEERLGVGLGVGAVRVLGKEMRRARYSSIGLAGSTSGRAGDISGSGTRCDW